MKQGQSIFLQVNQCQNLDEKIQGFVNNKKSNIKVPSFLNSFRTKKLSLKSPKQNFKKSLIDWRSLYAFNQTSPINSKQIQTQFKWYPSSKKRNQEKPAQSQFQNGPLQNYTTIVTKRAVSTQLGYTRHKMKRLQMQNGNDILDKIIKNKQAKLKSQSQFKQPKENPEQLKIHLKEKSKFRSTQKIDKEKSWITGNKNSFNQTARVGIFDRRILFNEEIDFFNRNNHATTKNKITSNFHFI